MTMLMEITYRMAILMTKKGVISEDTLYVQFENEPLQCVATVGARREEEWESARFFTEVG